MLIHYIMIECIWERLLLTALTQKTNKINSKFSEILRKSKESYHADVIHDNLRKIQNLFFLPL